MQRPGRLFPRAVAKMAMHDTGQPTCQCKTCKTADSEDGEVRCRACHKKYRQWLEGSAHYTPLWDGVVSAPADADEPRTNLDRALALKKEG